MFIILVQLLFVLKLVSGLPEDILRDAMLSVPELIRAYGYPQETHSVRTEDGYLLTLHRIPRGREQAAGAGAGAGRLGPPALVMHGLLSSSADWVVTLPGRALGYVLADAGYDVWLGNFRGNTFSKRHVRYDTTSKEFWDFSWHENGEFDLPAMIDYILNETRREQLYYAGHSMGTTAFFVMTSVRPEYNRKIRVMCALSSVTFMNHMESPIIRNIAWTNRGDEWLLNALGIYEFLPNNEIIDAATRKACQDNAPTQEVCSNVMFLIAGWDSQQLNKTQLPVILSHFPGGASTKQILHYAQEVVSGQFRQWDYGVISNTYFYGSSKPPNYNLTRVTAPIAIFYSDNDWLSNIIDVKRLQALLTRSVVRMIKVPWNKFNHLDYMWAIDAKRLVYDTVIQTFREYPL